MKRGVFICFIGTDGSGKTTQAKKLAEALENRGIKAKYLWNGFEPLLSKPLIAMARKLFLGKKDMVADYTDYLDARMKLSRNNFLFGIYYCLVLIDYFLQSLWKIRLPLARKGVLICDRYIYDVAAFLAFDKNYSGDQAIRTLRHYLYLLPKPNLTFLIDLPEEVAFERKDDIPSLSYLSEYRRIYLSMTKVQEVIIVDGTADPVELADSIQHKVTNYLSSEKNCSP